MSIDTHITDHPAASLARRLGRHRQDLLIRGLPYDRIGEVAGTVSRILLRALVGLVLPAGLLALWTWAVANEWLAPQILPAPSLVWSTAVDLVSSGNLFDQLDVSLVRLAVGLVCGGILGVAFGLVLGLSRQVDSYAGPTVRAIFLVPALGWLPFFMLLFGIGDELKIVLIAKTCFLPMMVNVYGAIRTLPSKYDDVSRSLELDRRAHLQFIILPAIMPAIATGLRQALSKGWKVLILVEMISSAAGIGYLMMWGRKSFQLDVVFVAMAVVGLVGLLFDRGVLWVQGKIADWSLHTAV